MGQICCPAVNRGENLAPIDDILPLKKMNSGYEDLNPQIFSDSTQLKQNYNFNPKVNKILGDGMFGKVYLATDKHDNNVAIKKIKIKDGAE